MSSLSPLAAEAILRTLVLPYTLSTYYQRQELEELESRARLGDGHASLGVELKAKEIKFKIQGIFQERLQVDHSGEIKLNWGDPNEQKTVQPE